MSEEIKVNPNQVTTHDAELMAENIAEGKEKAPAVDFEADYELAQQLSVSEVDKTEEGAKLAEQAVAPQFEIPEPEETVYVAEPTGNPDDYMDMANEIASRDEAVTEVTDDLVKKALEMGQPGKS